MINFDKVNLSYGEQVLFENLSWRVNDGERVGLVGDNGTGKTTLFKMILGKVVPDSGVLDITKKHRIGYLPQDLAQVDDVPLLAYLKKQCGMTGLQERIKELEKIISTTEPENEIHRSSLQEYGKLREVFRVKDGYTFESRAGSVLKGLGFRESDFQKNCRDFSGGWKMRILLGVILLNDPDIMLLDEPTNHLDTESMEWLESYLKDYRGTFITISHDHYFLDKMVNRIAELFGKEINQYKGNYSFYLKEKEIRLEQLKKEFENQQDQIKHIQAFINKFRADKKKASLVRSRIKMLERFDQINIEQERKSINIRFPECARSGKEVVRIKNLSKSYGKNPVLSEINFNIYRGERIALVGVNGAGKSTLSRMISKAEEPTSGDVEYGYRVSQSFFSQESAENVNYDNTVWNEVYGINPEVDDKMLRNMLGAFMFSGDDIYKKISILSGGEKSRVALLKILLQNSNFLILDEPTNHLDIKTKDIFQDALMNYSGTIMIVSHDRYFLDNLVTKVVEIKDHKITEYPGNYSYFIRKRKELQEARENQAQPATQQVVPIHESKNVKKVAKKKRELKSDIRNLENEIAELEQEKENINEKLCNPKTFKDNSKSKRLIGFNKKIEKKLSRLYKKYEKLIEQLELLE